MILHIELNLSNIYESDSVRKSVNILSLKWNQSETLMLLKFVISVSTVVLVVLVFVYHRLDLSLYCIDNSIDDWRIGLTHPRIFIIVIECFICAIHPFPGKLVVKATEERLTVIPQSADDAANVSYATTETLTHSIPLDIFLSVPMFARLYLLCRVLVLHSKLVTDASSQSLGYLNRITFDFRFVFKSSMTKSPELVLACLICLLFIIASWCLKACEYHLSPEKFGFFNSMWLVAITFLTVG
jgi:potassium intermediate/small conductance calcium-activated channel subfamily N